MSEPRDPLDDLIAGLTEEITPTADEVARARTVLSRAIARESSRRARRWRVAISGAVVAVVVATALFVIEIGQRSPAQAAMEEIARVLEQVSPLSIDDEEFLYSVTASEGLSFVPRPSAEAESDEYLVYLLPRTVETWRGTSGAIQLREEAGEPIFFTPDGPALYELEGLADIDGVGEMSTQTFGDAQVEEWPSGKGELDAAIRRTMVNNRGLPETVEYLDVALDIIRETLQPPDVRASALVLIGELDGLELVESGVDESTFAIEYTDRGVDTRLTFTVGDDGHLRFEEILNLTADQEFGIPADTPSWSATYSTPVIVGSLDEPSQP